MGVLDELLKKGKKAAEKLASADDADKAKQFLNALVETANDLADAMKKADLTDLKKAVGGFLDEAVTAAKAEKENEEKSVQNVEPDFNGEISYATASYAGIRKDDYYMELPEDSLDCKAKILEVLAADFPQYEVREEVSPTTIGGKGRFMNYSLGLYFNGQPRLFIMIIYGSQGRKREYRWSKEQAAAVGITMINFLKYSPNRYWYIKERLSQYL
ncbi:MAG: hypothetical protein IJI05_06055 [Erysipelotrichaceae bacterium]|nr:hypothetical protein [Erysipelotrichaceae bacterium]